MEYFTLRYLLWAVALGGLSAVALPLGSAVGLLSRPRPQIISILQAFGAGALLAALAVELVAPTVFALTGHDGSSHAGDPKSAFYALLAGSVLGGILFTLFDGIVNSFGGFLRKTSTSITYFKATRRERQKALLAQLSNFPLLQSLSADHINTLVGMVDPAAWEDGELIHRTGDAAERAVFIVGGTVVISDDGRTVTDLESGAVLGVGPLLLDTAYVADATARGTVAALTLSRSDFDRLRALSPEFEKACRDATDEQIDILQEYLAERQQKADKWLRTAKNALTPGFAPPDSIRLRRAREEHKGAPLAVWLGMVIDGIPESFVIGAGLLISLRAWSGSADTVTFAAIVPYTLIAGLFLSNFPEALASSANMRMQGWSRRRIFFLWVSLLVITAAGAGIGFVAVESLDPTWLVFAEGIAAGAMLTMIAAAMIPEAVHLGNSGAVGLSTLAGFLSAIAFKLLE